MAALKELKELTEADLHHVFAVERRGDTLIVAPRGDATSFPEHHFRAAVTVLRKRLNGTHPCSVIVDLSRLEYAGLAMLDVFDDLITAIVWRGETVVVAGATDDTRRVLQEYRLGRDWTHYDDLPSAARAVVREPFWKSATRRPELVIAMLAGLLLIGGMFAFLATRTHPDRIAHQQVMALWREYAKAQNEAAEQPDLIAATNNLSQRVDELAATVAEEERMPEIVAAAQQLQQMVRHPRLKDLDADRTLGKLLVAALNKLERDGN